MTTTYLIDNLDDMLLDELKQLAQKMGRTILIRPVGEKTTHQPLDTLPKSLDNDEPKTLAGVLLSIPKLDVEDDFFRIPQEPMREFDWGE